ncbi:MAG TPA: hypothetical protein VKB00_00355, partial [Candidatus Limnocylindrales bacterium]|nr:hypothetical protein [Candidatus Limnocylindrales bacterium]
MGHRGRIGRGSRGRVLALASTAAAAVVLWAAGLAGAAPANDAFSSATVVTGATGTWSGSNVGATRESGEPIDIAGGGTTIWYRWTAPSSGPATFDTFGSSFDTILSVYTGTSVKSLSLVARNDDSTEWGPPTSRVTFTATANVTYRIQVDGRWGATGALTLTLNRPRPDNDA